MPEEMIGGNHFLEEIANVDKPIYEIWMLDTKREELKSG